jgi:hypothetical protein
MSSSMARTAKGANRASASRPRVSHGSLKG